jgi:hypothetical protein
MFPKVDKAYLDSLLGLSMVLVIGMDMDGCGVMII